VGIRGDQEYKGNIILKKGGKRSLLFQFWKGGERAGEVIFGKNQASGIGRVCQGVQIGRAAEMRSRSRRLNLGLANAGRPSRAKGMGGRGNVGKMGKGEAQ